MADVYQTGVVATLDRLGQLKIERIEQELVKYSAIRPITLVLPSLYNKLHGPALPKIVEELKQVRYLGRSSFLSAAQTATSSNTPASSSRFCLTRRSLSGRRGTAHCLEKNTRG